MSRPFGENEAVGRRIQHLSACCRDSERFSERLVPWPHHRKRAESRRDGLQGDRAPDLSDAEWSKRARKSPRRRDARDTFSAIPATPRLGVEKSIPRGLSSPEAG
jgi:hypothetical protein